MYCKENTSTFFLSPNFYVSQLTVTSKIRGSDAGQPIIFYYLNKNSMIGLKHIFRKNNNVKTD